MKKSYDGGKKNDLEKSRCRTHFPPKMITENRKIMQDNTKIEKLENKIKN